MCQSFLQISDLSPQQIQRLFELSLTALDFPFKKSIKPLLALVFLESSTRTRMSFEIAAKRLGFQTVLFDGTMGTSLDKGETIHDTLMNIAAMSPDGIILRSGDDVDQLEISKNIQKPMINAGWGRKEHPTQALLDILTLIETRKIELQLHQNTEPHKILKSERLLIVGDVKHSRVVGSHRELSKILGYELAFCGPKDWLPDAFKENFFLNLREGLKWATSVMLLRVQKERHNHGEKISVEDYSLKKENLLNLKKNVWIMHPGPVNYGVELDVDVYNDSRSLILKQVNYGVKLRAGLLKMMFDKEA